MVTHAEQVAAQIAAARVEAKAIEETLNVFVLNTRLPFRSSGTPEQTTSDVAGPGFDVVHIATCHADGTVTRHRDVLSI